MTSCPICGTENTVGAKFCPECGASLIASESPARDVRKVVTVLFADVAGSTELGERLDPETVRALMDRHFRIMRGIIESHGGMVEKFIGDAVMAVFGVPTIHEDDALRAVRAAAEIRTALGALDTAAAGAGSLTFRTGINTGEVFARDPTGGQSFVTGDPVNTAARLEQAAAPGEILLGQSTYRLVRDAVTVEPSELIAAKGKSEPLRAYRLVGVGPGLAGHARRLDAALVGRQRELGRLEQAFRATVEERTCQLFTLLGAAGVGKSRLVAEFAAAVDTQATVLRGRCLSYGDGITYWPIGEIVRTIAGIDDADSAEVARGRLRSVVDGERDADAISDTVAGAIGLSNHVASQDEVFWGIRKLLEHVAATRPVVVVIEDIHWAEPTLFDLIEHLADLTRDVPLLVLCPARPEVLEIRAGWGGGKLNATTVLLEPLGPDATAQLIAELPGGPAVPASIAARILTAAEGNPLFIEEFLGMLTDDGLLVEAADGSWSATDGFEDVRVPASISALLAARLERLAPHERAVAEHASVVGRVFEQAAVTELASDAMRPDVGRSLLALVRKELIRPERSEPTAADAFKFRHILIRDAAYEAIPKSERAILHERVADWLERTVGERLAEYEEIVGYHLDQAYRYAAELGGAGASASTLAERAGSHLAAAGGYALDRGDLAAAARSLSRATSLFPSGSPMRLALMPDLGFVLYDIGRIPEAEAILDQAVEEATASHEPLLATRAELERAMLGTLVGGRSIGPRQVAEASIPALERAGDEAGLARAYLVMATAAWVQARIHDAVEAREQALEHASRCGDKQIPRRASFWGAESYGPAPAITEIELLETDLASTSGDPMRRAKTSFALSGLYAMRGRAADARAAYRDVATMLHELGAQRRAAAGHEMGGCVELLLDDPAAAEAWLQDGIDQLRGMGETTFTLNMLSLQVIALARQGKVEAAINLADRFDREASSEDILAQVSVRTGRAIALCSRGDVIEAVAVAREAVSLADETDASADQADAYLALAEALVGSGDREGAEFAASRAATISAAKENLIGERRASAFLEHMANPGA